MFKRIIHALRKSIVFRQLFWYQILVDALCVLAILLLWRGFVFFIDLLDIESLLAAKNSAIGTAMQEEFIKQMHTVSFFGLFLIILLPLCVFIARSTAHYLIYSRLTNKKQSFKKAMLFLLFGFFLVFFYFLLFAFAIGSKYPAFFFLLFTLLFLFFAPFLFFTFFEQNSLLKAYAKGFERIIKNVHYLFFAYLPLIALFLVLNIVAGFLLELPYRIGAILSLLLLFAVLAWARIFLYDVWLLLQKK